MSAHPAVIPKELFECIQAKNDARCIRLPHPRTGLPALFLPFTTPSGSETPSPRSCILEIQSIAPDAKRSWFLSERYGEVVSDGKLLMLVPIDPTFLFIPLLEAVSANGANARFLPFQDLLDEIANVFARSQATAEDGSQLVPVTDERDIAGLSQLDCVVSALRRICEVKEPAPGLEVFRFASSKALDVLRAKISVLSGTTTFTTFPSLQRTLAKDGLASGIDQAGSNEALLAQARTKASCEILSHYLSPLWKEKLAASYDFTLLDAHLKSLADETQATLSRADSEPKLKDATNAPNKKPKKGTVGVEKLKKVNVTGMAKLSNFFTKKP